MRATRTGAVQNPCCRIIGMLRQEAAHTQHANNSSGQRMR